MIFIVKVNNLDWAIGGTIFSLILREASHVCWRQLYPCTANISKHTFYINPSLLTCGVASQVIKNVVSVCLSVRLSVRPSVRLSVRPHDISRTARNFEILISPVDRYWSYLGQVRRWTMKVNGKWVKGQGQTFTCKSVRWDAGKRSRSLLDCLLLWDVNQI